MMSVDDTLTCSFQILKASEKKGKFGFGNMSRPGTPPHKVTKGLFVEKFNTCRPSNWILKGLAILYCTSSGT